MMMATCMRAQRLALAASTSTCEVPRCRERYYRAFAANLFEDDTHGPVYSVCCQSHDHFVCSSTDFCRVAQQCSTRHASGSGSYSFEMLSPALPPHMSVSCAQLQAAEWDEAAAKRCNYDRARLQLHARLIQDVYALDVIAVKQRTGEKST